MSPVPKGTRFRYRKLGPTKRQRLAFVDSKVVEVTGYRRKNKKWVKQYSRRMPRKRK